LRRSNGDESSRRIVNPEALSGRRDSAAAIVVPETGDVHHQASATRLLVARLDMI
jgi:hypothetical protein